MHFPRQPYASLADAVGPLERGTALHNQLYPQNAPCESVRTCRGVDVPGDAGTPFSRLETPIAHRFSYTPLMCPVQEAHMVVVAVR